MKNIGDRYGGAITAALFLAEFVGDTPWVHLDIAGPAFAEGERLGPKGATGVPVRTLVRYILDERLTAVAEDASDRRRAPAPSSPSRAPRRRRDLVPAGRWRSGPPPGREVHLRCSRTATGIERPLAGSRRARGDAPGRDGGRRRGMGLASVRILGSHDGELENTQDVREAVVRRIREVRAETVVTVRPHRLVLREPLLQPLRPPDRRRDRAGRGVPRRRQPALLLRAPRRGPGRQRGARRLARLDERAEPHRGRLRHFETKIAALAEHASQLTEGIAFFEEFLAKEAVELGEKIGASHAEDFRVLDLS